jgi:hypothetical protein
MRRWFRGDGGERERGGGWKRRAEAEAEPQEQTGRKDGKEKESRSGGRDPNRSRLLVTRPDSTREASGAPDAVHAGGRPRGRVSAGSLRVFAVDCILV